MRHVLEPYYRLVIDGKSVAIGTLEELRFMTRQTELPFEIYAYYRSIMEAPTTRPLSIAKMKEASEMVSKGVSLQIVADKLKIPRKYLVKIISKNNLIRV